MASGLQEFNKKYINKINNVLKNQPEIIKGFVNYMSDVALTTKYAYMHDVINFINKVNKPVEELTFDDFSDYIAGLEYKENGDPVTSSYRIAVYSALKKFNLYLYTTKRIPEYYMANIKRPKTIESQNTIEKRQNGFLTKTEISKYIYTVERNNVNKYRQVGQIWNKRDMLIIKIFLNTGIRCSALSKLDKSSIDFKNKTLIVTDKGSKVNKYDLSDDILDELEEWIYIRETEIKDTDSALFISNRRRRMDPITIYNVVNKYSKNISDKKITPHKLRATYGTQLYNETRDIYFVQECMGHSNPKTTELYVRDKKQNFKKASEIMSKIVG